MSSELQYCRYLLASQPVEHTNDLVNGESVFEVLEDRSDWNASATKDPRTADFSGDAFNSFAL